MTKRELLKLLENAKDDAQIFVISSDYVHEDDSTWMADTQSEFQEITVDSYGEIYFRVDTEFMC